jgi:hypothetical protein
MVRGLDGFREWFRGYEHHYAIIGGTACDLLISETGGDFRATRDIDMVLLVEVLDTNFGARLWEYIKSGGYEHRRASTEKPQFYRFAKPVSQDYPHMIELFSRRIEKILLPGDAILTPLPIEDDISSLSAILLDDGYYEFLKSGIRITEGLPILDAEHLIPFKAKAWLDLTARKANGVQVDSKHIKKHKSDIIMLSGLLRPDNHVDLPESVREDFAMFIAANSEDAEKLQRIALLYGVVG